jgi:hypothetical protein
MAWGVKGIASQHLLVLHTFYKHRVSVALQRAQTICILKHVIVVSEGLCRLGLWAENSDFYTAFGATAGMYSFHQILSFLHTNFSRFFHCSSINSMVTWFYTRRIRAWGGSLVLLRASPAVLGMWSEDKIRWRRSNEDPTCVGLAQENGFGFAFLHL